MQTFAPETCHEHLSKAAPRQFAFDPQKDFQTWRQAVDTKLRELLGILPEKVPLNLRKEYEREVVACFPRIGRSVNFFLTLFVYFPHPLLIFLRLN
jgi:hypothetical protein